jgi:predicted RNase H-like HicB family nuclease
MKEIVLRVERDDDRGWLVASWDAPNGGGVTTQGQDLTELQANVRDAVRCHFGKSKAPRAIRLHFLTDPVLATA